eukprot:TRINITY_DN1615_c1_g1_i1.p2 TRINITY_DN1615_c1_g1~~TRINITY_DN1615_c1_g1_i1.p2  ORF type:complete len:559 (-),score=129.89 TRINITY_DN1615_c1_g1_i1:334-2010(-)
MKRSLLPNELIPFLTARRFGNARVIHERWNDVEERRRFLDGIGKKLDVKTSDDWYTVRRKEFLAAGGFPSLTLLQYYNNSLSKVLVQSYPEVTWIPGRFNRLPSEEIERIEIQQEILRGIEERLSIKYYEDWYQIGSEDFVKMAGRIGGISTITKMLSFHNGSMIEMLMNLKPDCDWMPWKFERLPHHFWKDAKMQRRFMDRLAIHLGVRESEQWYEVTKQDIIDFDGRGLLREYPEMKNLLMSIYKEHPWNPKEFRSPRRDSEHQKHGHYRNPENRKKFFDELARTLGIRQWQDWYKISRTKVLEHKGTAVLKYYPKHSLINALVAIYPERNWEVWRFVESPKNYWDDETNGRKFLEYLAEKLGIRNFDDWFTISNAEVAFYGGTHFLAKHGGLFSALRAFYPKGSWTSPPDRIQGSKGQRLIYRHLLEIFSDEPEILYSHRHPELRYSESDIPMELDIYIPTLRLAFEYQGQHHYENEDIQRRDAEKRKACKLHSISLVSIPYWWDRSKESLLAEISKQRPDLVKSTTDGNLIPRDNSSKSKVTDGLISSSAFEVV